MNHRGSETAGLIRQLGFSEKSEISEISEHFPQNYLMASGELPWTSLARALH